MKTKGAYHTHYPRSHSEVTLGSLREPPAKESWKVAEGEGFYSAYILRVEDSLDVLIDSLNKKRPSMPLTQYEDEFLSSTTEDEVGVLKSQKDNKKQEVAEIKKQELSTKRLRAFPNANEFENDSDSDDPEVIPSTKYEQLKNAYDFLEKEKERVEEKLKSVEKKFSDCQKQMDEFKMENAEVVHLRSLNRQLQEKLLAIPDTQGGCCHAVINQPDIQSVSETTEIELGAGIMVDRKVYEDIMNLDHVRKFTKSLAVVIWGSQMREYLTKRGKSDEIEEELKKRNKYISDKIQCICKNISLNKSA
ncbi:hypothetical protein JTE90_011093 [Oedothorax gibbosus]|uniref:BEN domain-containing protein n=1 Tax=Oedothorax gibbosus TaxID=931172 RepID=A0AAV6TWG5_9ARAC|nr:hypothetical protein JTE90_011093 [Oedothorax gibbosus]